jgi:hypothetical protein
VKKESAAWLAGFWDADGTLGIYKRHTYLVPSISCTNTDKKLIDHVCSILDESSVSYRVDYQDRGDRTNARPAWTIKLESRPRVLSLLQHLEPYLVGKQQQARLVMEWCGLPVYRNKRCERNTEIVETLKSLNSRGRFK